MFFKKNMFLQPKNPVLLKLNGGLNLFQKYILVKL